MAQVQELPTAALLPDIENPRLSESNEGENETLRALAEEQGPKLAVLAKDIVQHGLNPGDLFYVLQLDDGSQRFAVLEGNRRLTALRALENPTRFTGAIKTGTLSKLKSLGEQYRKAPIENVNCTIFNDREEAHHWIELRHTGEANGAGTVRWRSDAASRFAAGTEAGPTQTQALDFLERRGDITSLTRSQVPATTLRRLLDTPYVREKIGLGYKDKKLQVVDGEEPVAKALNWIVGKLISGEITEPKISSVENRKQFADELPEDIVVTLTDDHKKQELDDRDIGLFGNPGAGKPTPAEDAKPKKSKEATAKSRTNLIPQDCVMNITDERLRRIAGELRKLHIEDFTNSVGVMMRVFIELSGDSYLVRNGLSGITEKAALNKKIAAIATDLQNRAKLSAKQVQPVLKACQKGSLLAPSVTLMHEYVHNPYMFPTASDLRDGWDNLQPYMVALWEI
jgi:hypothetical protein